MPVGQLDEGAFWNSGQLAAVGTRSELQGVLGRCVALDKSRALKRTLSMLIGWSLVFSCLGLVVYALVDNGSLGMVAGGAGGAGTLQTSGKAKACPPPLVARGNTRGP